MKGYDSIPSTAEEGSAFLNSPSFDDVDHDNRRRRRDLALAKWTAGAIGLLVLVLVSSVALNGDPANKNLWGSLRSGSIVKPTTMVLPSPPTPPGVDPDKIYNNNKHVKLLAYPHQKVNHFQDDNRGKSQFWTQRYYRTLEHFKGPGSPIIVLIGGEAVQDNGFIYPYIMNQLASSLGAAVIQPEHRFYGHVKPVENATKLQLLELLTVEQALADIAGISQYVAQETLGCSGDRTSPHYCPIITVGGSYAAFLAAMSRIVYPEIIDMGYSSSGPILMYGQMVPDPNIYYDIMTQAYDHASPGCADAIRNTLYETRDTILRVASETGSLAKAAEAVGLCGDSLPGYVTDADILADTVMEVCSNRFHDASLFSYPPGEDTSEYKICQTFQHSDQPLKTFLFTLFQSFKNFTVYPAPPECFDLTTQVPKDGKDVNDTPDDPDHDGIVWDFTVCTDLVFIFGYSEKSFLPPKEASYETLIQRCRDRFNVTPRPYELVDKYDFGDLTDHSNILFTNGMQDCWAGGGITWNVSDTVLSLYFPNGAHHSELSHQGPTDRDTPDIKYGYHQIETILGGWVEDIRSKQHK